MKGLFVNVASVCQIGYTKRDKWHIAKTLGSMRVLLEFGLSLIHGVASCNSIKGKGVLAVSY